MSVRELINKFGGGVRAKTTRERPMEPTPMDEFRTIRLTALPNIPTTDPTPDPTPVQPTTDPTPVQPATDPSIIQNNQANETDENKLNENINESMGDECNAFNSRPDAYSDSESEITTDSEEVYIHQYTPDDLLVENIGNIYSKRASLSNVTSISVTDSRDAAVEANEHEINRQQQIQNDLNDLLNISDFSDNDSESNGNRILMNYLYTKYGITNTMAENLATKFDLHVDDYIDKIFEIDPCDIVVDFIEHYVATTGELIRLYKLLNYCIKNVQRKDDSALSMSECKWLGYFNKACIAFKIKSCSELRIPTTQPVEDSDNNEEQIIMYGSKKYEMFNDKLGKSSERVFVGIDKLGNNMQIEFVFKNNNKKQRLLINDNGIIYKNGKYYKSLIPYENNYIDGGSTMVIKMKKKMDKKNMKVTVKFTHIKNDKVINKVSTCISFKGQKGDVFCTGILMQDKGDGEYVL